MSDRNSGSQTGSQSGSSQDTRQGAIEGYSASRNAETGRTPADTIDEAPLIALAAGLAAGALIAALLPVTRQERKLVKPVGDRVSTAARGAADAARRAGSDKLRELGLTTDAVAKRVGEAGRATAQAVIGAVRDEAGNR
jgi:hypothetical protein